MNRTAIYLACCLSVGLTGCGSQPNRAYQPANFTSANEAAPALAASTMDLLREGSAKACATEDVKRTVLKTAAPDTSGAKTLAESGLYPFHSGDVDGFAAAINLDLGLETQSGVDKAISSVKCDGRITLSAPAYHMPAERTFDISYEIRPSAESADSFVVSANSGVAKAAAQEMLDQIIQQMTSRMGEQAARKAAIAQQAEQTRIAEAGRHPSFVCAHVTSYVLNTICSDQTLIELDNQLAAAYRAASVKADQSGDTFGKLSLVSDERAWIAMRQKCTDVDCITTLYHDRIETLTNRAP